MKSLNFLKVIVFFIPNFRYEQPSGYRPAPLDLSEVFLSSEQEEVVSLLAENDHNVWAQERIKQGWTYGAQQVSSFQDQLGSNVQNAFCDGQSHTDCYNKTNFELHSDCKSVLDNKSVPFTCVHMSPKDQIITPSSKTEMNIVGLCLCMCCFVSCFSLVFQDVKAKRSTYLIPYSLLDEQTRRLGRQTVTEALSTLLVYGYILEPLNQELGMFGTIWYNIYTVPAHFTLFCHDAPHMRL